MWNKRVVDFLKASDFNCVRTILPINLEIGDIIEGSKGELAVVEEFLGVTEKNVIVVCCPILADGNIATAFGNKRLIKRDKKCKFYGKGIV